MSDFRKDVFVNPYNFIKLPEEKVKAYTDKDKHSGVIHYTVTTKTPLFIPNSSQDETFDVKDKDGKRIKDHKSYDFFSYTDLSENEKKYNNDTKFYEPVIPGSEMRGVIRNVYETLTDSCMSVLNGEQKPIKRIMTAYKPALLHWNGTVLELLEAKSYRIRANFDTRQLQNGEMIDFEGSQSKVVSNYSLGDESLSKYGFLIKWGFGNDESQTLKKHFHIFEEKIDKDGNGFLPIRENLDLKNVKNKIVRIIDSYLEQTTVSEKNKEAYTEYLRDIKGFLNYKDRIFDYFPINYSEVNGDIKFSPATFTKEESNKTINDYSRDFVPCMDKNNLCPTCDLFGTILEDKSISSKIRFSDLQVKEKKENCKDYYEKKVTLSNLSGPKLGNVDFYLQKPSNAKFWTYDYFVENNKINKYNSILRGRKYYWHHQKVQFPTVEPTNQNKTVRPVTKDIVFCGDLYFNGISKKQLNQLIYILNTGKHNLGYKLGMGKPLGLGSIACKVEGVAEREIAVKENNISYETKNYDYGNINYENAHFSESVKDEFEKIASFNAIPKDIEIIYPKTKSPDDNGFEWFVANHSNGNITKREKMAIKYALPNILDSDNTLPRFEALAEEESVDSRSNSTHQNKYFGKNFRQNTNNKKYASSNKYKPR